MNQHVIIRDVDKSFPEGTGKRSVLRGACARFDRGEFIVIKGRSGCGKTTLLNLIAGLEAPDSGLISIDEQDINGLDERSRTLFRRRCFGFVFQFFNLIPTLTAFENVSISLELNQVAPVPRSQRIEELLDRVRLSDRADSFPDQLSGGEQQRIAVCRAVAHRPEVVLADEPTGNLDAESERELLSLLRSLPKESGSTLVVATHSDLVASFADRVYLISDGALQEQ